MQKVEEIAKDPDAYKPIRFPLAGLKKVHVGSYALLFSVDEARRTIVLED